MVQLDLFGTKTYDTKEDSTKIYLPPRYQSAEPVMVPFGKKKKQNKSSDLLAVEDYSYFMWFLNRADGLQYYPQAQDRFRAVHHVMNNAVMTKKCRCCGKPVCLVSLAIGHDGPTASTYFTYASKECFENDPQANYHRTQLAPLKADALWMEKKVITKDLHETLLHCMGMKEGRKTKQYLNDFFNTVELTKPL
jgi:hypothetical protein